MYGVRRDSAMKPIWLWMSAFHAWTPPERNGTINAAAVAVLRRDDDDGLGWPIVVVIVTVDLSFYMKRTDSISMENEKYTLGRGGLY